jgi:hypothetical protein
VGTWGQEWRGSVSLVPTLPTVCFLHTEAGPLKALRVCPSSLCPLCFMSQGCEETFSTLSSESYVDFFSEALAVARDESPSVVEAAPLPSLPPHRVVLSWIGWAFLSLLPRAVAPAGPPRTWSASSLTTDQGFFCILPKFVHLCPLCRYKVVH